MRQTPPQSLTDEERERVEQIDRFVALGASGVHGLLGMLSDRSWTVRRAVVAGLASLGDDAVGPLCAWLRDVRSSERGIAAAIDALAASRGEGADAAVLALAVHPTPAVVADAAQVLGRREATIAAETLGRLLEHPDDNVAVSGIEALGRLGLGAPVEPLVRTVIGGNFFRAFAAIGVLGSLGDPRVLQPLVGLLHDERYAAEAARALGQTGDRSAIEPLAALLGAPEQSLARVAAVALSNLIELHELRFGASSSFDEITRAAIAPHAARLMQLVDQAEPTEQAAICAIIGRLADPVMLPELLRLLDGEPVVAEQAARAIRLMTRQPTPVLRQVLQQADSAHRAVLLPLVTLPQGVVDEVLDDPDAEVRALACESAARSGDVSAIRQLFSLLADPQARVAQAALTAIIGLGGDHTEELALAAADSENLGVRRAAVRILSALGFRAAYDVFRRVITDADERLRELATYGLAFLDHPDAAEVVRQQASAAGPRVRAAALRALSHCAADEKNVDVLCAGLRDGDAWVRYFACQSLGKLGCEVAVEDIAARLTDEAGQVRNAALEALSLLRSDTAWTHLERAADAEDPDMRRAALVGLGLSGRPVALPRLLAAAHDGDLATRLVALSGLARFQTPECLRELGCAALSKDDQVASAAVSLLADCSAPEADRLLIEAVSRVDMRHPAHAALSAGSRSRAVSVLQALRHVDAQGAAALTAALVRMDSAAARAALFEALTLPNAAARKSAAWALAELSGGEAVAALGHAAESDPDLEVRRTCAALISRGDVGRP